jgi:hypothetical protein
MTASSDPVGTCWSLGLAALTQLLGVSQSPPAGLIQFIVANKVRPSSRRTAGRKTRRSTGDEVRSERLNVRRMGDCSLAEGTKLGKDEAIVDPGAHTERPDRSGSSV